MGYTIEDNDVRLDNLENNEYKVLYFKTISTTAGTITTPTDSTILLDEFYSGGDAIVETLINGKPSGQSPLTIGGAVVSVVSFDVNGNYTLSGTPSSFDVALLYVFKIRAFDYSNVDLTYELNREEVDVASKDYVKEQIIAAASGLTAYFFYKTFSAIIGTYYQMTKTPPSGGLQVISGLPSIPSGTLLATFMTNAGTPNITFTPSGVVKFHIHATQTAGTKATQLYAEFYTCNSLGASQVLRCTTLYSNVLTGISAEYTVDGAIPSSFNMLSTDLYLVKWYSYSPGSGSAPTIDLSLEDATASRIELPTTAVDLSAYTLKSNAIICLHRDSSDSVPLIGSTAQTLVKSFLLTGGTVVPNYSLYFEIFTNKDLDNGVSTLRILYNTINSLSGATTLATFQLAAAANAAGFLRNIKCKSATVTELMHAPTTSSVSDIVATTNTPVTQLNIDWTPPYYIILSLQNASLLDTSVISDYKLFLK